MMTIKKIADRYHQYRILHRAQADKNGEDSSSIIEDRRLSSL